MQMCFATSPALAAAGLLAYPVRRVARAGRDQDPLHAGLEAAGHPRLVLLGQGEGLFRRRKLDVTIDQGEGSAATVTRIMSGAYDAGFGDINAIIQNAGAKPGEAPVMVYMIYSKAPFALLTKATSPIKTLKDLAGNKLGTPPGGASVKLLPLLAKKNGIDYGKIDLLNVAPNLQEQMLLQGQVDVIAIFTATSYMNLVVAEARSRQGFPLDLLRRLRPRPLFQRRHGLGEARQGEAGGGEGAGARHQPGAEGSRRESRCRDRAAWPSSEPLINKDIEKRRLLYVYKTLIATPEAARTRHRRRQATPA